MLADRLERALSDEVNLLALTIDERAIILGQLEDPPDGLAELRARIRSRVDTGAIRRAWEIACLTWVARGTA